LRGRLVGLHLRGQLGDQPYLWRQGWDTGVKNPDVSIVTFQSVDSEVQAAEVRSAGIWLVCWPK
jgi:hypothetical protein